MLVRALLFGEGDRGIRANTGRCDPAFQSHGALPSVRRVSGTVATRKRSFEMAGAGPVGAGVRAVYGCCGWYRQPTGTPMAVPGLVQPERRPDASTEVGTGRRRDGTAGGGGGVVRDGDCGHRQ